VGGGQGVLDLDKYVSLADMFYMGGHLRLQLSCVRVNMVCLLEHENKSVTNPVCFICVKYHMPFFLYACLRRVFSYSYIYVCS